MRRRGLGAIASLKARINYSQFPARNLEDASATLLEFLVNRKISIIISQTEFVWLKKIPTALTIFAILGYQHSRAAARHRRGQWTRLCSDRPSTRRQGRKLLHRLDPGEEEIVLYTFDPLSHGCNHGGMRLPGENKTRNNNKQKTVVNFPSSPSFSKSDYREHLNSLSSPHSNRLALASTTNHGRNRIVPKPRGIAGFLNTRRRNLQ